MSISASLVSRVRSSFASLLASLTDEHSPARRQRVQVVVALIVVGLVPAIYAGLLTWANDDTIGRINQVPALIVNDDQPATLQDGTTLRLGDSLSDELLTSTKPSNFSWTVADTETAQSQLASGQVLAVLWIPADFSSSVASLQGDPGSAARATLTIETNDAVNTVAGNMAANIGDAIGDALAESVSEEYLEKVNLGFTATHDAVARAADGADSLHEGTQSAAAGSDELAGGLNDLSSGATDLADGTTTLAAGAQGVSDGAAQLSAGLDRLNASGPALAQGAADVADGAAQLEQGVNQLTTRASSLADAVEALSGRAEAALDHATTLRDTLDHVYSDATGFASQAGALRDTAAGLDSNWDTLTDGERRAIVSQVATQSASLSEGATDVERGTGRLHSDAIALVGSSDSAGLRAVVGERSQLAAQAKNVRPAITALTTGVSDLADGSARVAAGTSEFVAAVDRLDHGATTLAGASQSLANGSTRVQSGANTLAAGSRDAATGAASLSSGLSDIEGGAGDLANGLAEGRDEIPRFSDAEAAQLAHAAAVPVEHRATRANEVPTSAYGLGPYFMALALWIGGIALYQLTDPLRGKRLGTWLGGLSSFAPGAAMAVGQSLALVLTLRYLLGIEAANLAGLTALAVLVSLTFVAVNQALAGLLGTPGRFLALVLIVLQLAAAGGTYPVQTAPTFFRVVHNWLPLTHAVRGFRSLMAGGSVDLSGGVFVILAWLVASLAVTSLAAKRRQPEPSAVPSRVKPQGRFSISRHLPIRAVLRVFDQPAAWQQ